MKNNRGVAMTLLVVISLPACQLVIPSPIPPPGWRTPVRDLIVGDGAFPLDWTAAMDTSSDPTVNHVGRIWSNPLGSRVDEGIWRAYTEADAKEKYAELLRQSIFHARTMYTITLFNLSLQRKLSSLAGSLTSRILHVVG